MSGIVPSQPPPTPLNSVTDINATATNVRSYEFNLLVAQGRIQGHSWVAKSGRNADIDTASIPEDVWGGDSVYTGFPTGAAEIITAVSDNVGDTGILTITYLASFTSTAYQTATITLTGTTPVDFAISAVRVHSAQYSTGVATTFNLGNITIRHKVTTTNVFLILEPGTNQSYSSGYTVPYNSNGYLYDLFSQIEDGNTGSVEGCLWTRLYGLSPRLRRNFVASQGADYWINMHGSLSFPALTDIIIRVTFCAANNTIVLGGYNLLVVQNQ